jgi:hypothetical protein
MYTRVGKKVPFLPLIPAHSWGPLTFSSVAVDPRTPYTIKTVVITRYSLTHRFYGIDCIDRYNFVSIDTNDSCVPSIAENLCGTCIIF